MWWHHPWNDGSWVGWGFGMFGMALFWIVVVVAVALAVRWLGERPHTAGPGPQPPRESPMEILQRRYAAGEIGKQEFEEKKRDLS